MTANCVSLYVVVNYYNNNSSVPYIHKGQFKSLHTEEEPSYSDKIRSVSV